MGVKGKIGKEALESADKIKDILKKKPTPKKTGKKTDQDVDRDASAIDTAGGKKLGPGGIAAKAGKKTGSVTGKAAALGGAAFLGSAFGGAGSGQGDTLMQSGAPGDLFGATPTGMMGALGMGGMFGGGGGVQTAPETINIAPGKSVFEQILGVLISIKQDTSSLLSSFESAREASGRALEDAQGAAAESEAESSRRRLASGARGRGITSSITGAARGAAGLAGRALGLAFVADTMRKLLFGDDKGKENKEGIEGQGQNIQSGALGGMPNIFDDETGVEGTEKSKLEQIGEVIKDFGKNAVEAAKESLIASKDQVVKGVEQILEGAKPTDFDQTKVATGLQNFNIGVSKFFDDFLNPFSLLNLIPGIDEDNNVLQLKNITEYIGGKPGQPSPMFGDISDAFNKAMGSDFVKGVEKQAGTITKSMQNGLNKFGEEVEKDYHEFTDFLSQTTEKVKNLFSFDTIKKAVGIKTEPQTPSEQIAEIKSDKNLNKIRENVIDELADSGMVVGGEKFENSVGFNKSYEDLNPEQKSLVDNRVDSIQRGQLKKVPGGVPGGDAPIYEAPPVNIFGKNSVPEKDPDKISMGTKMRSGAVNPFTLANISGGTTINDNKTINNNNASNSVTNNVEKGGGGGIGTRNPDVSLYSTNLVPSFMQGRG